MPNLLGMSSKKGREMFHVLLVDLCNFFNPFLRMAEMTDAIRVLYKGTLRLLLILLHDFPEFLCDFHFSLCDAIPSTCIQLRNLILSAFPRNMRLPDPFTPNLKVDLLPEISQSPIILSDYETILRHHEIFDGLETYLKTRSPDTFLPQLREKLLDQSNDPTSGGSRYNVSLFNALVLFVGVKAIEQMQNKSQSTLVTQSAPMDIFESLARDLDSEGTFIRSLTCRTLMNNESLPI
jgi:CCR4-NOT transcription complex subunit 1